MNRGLERAAAITGVVILLASLQFGACLLGGPAALTAALVLSVGFTFLWLHFDLPHAQPWLLPLIVSLATVCAVVVVETTLRPSFATWFAPLFAAAGSSATLAILLRSRARCGLCGRRLGTQTVVFQCPRCSMEVCDETCWSFEHRRCQLCLEQRVPVLPTGESWWMRVTGPRAHHGRCQICLGSAEQVDLRACTNCRRVQCRDCWDFNNGECARCSTALRDLPPALTMAVAKISSSEALSR